MRPVIQLCPLNSGENMMSHADWIIGDGRSKDYAPCVTWGGFVLVNMFSGVNA